MKNLNHTLQLDFSEGSTVTFDRIIFQNGPGQSIKQILRSTRPLDS
jgi:hypothetical protein